MYGFIVALSLLGTVSEELGGAAEQFDIVELNHYYDENGSHLLDQLLFYRWDTKKEDYICEAWRIKRENVYLRLSSGMCAISLSEGGITKKIVSSHFRETWSQHDPEIFERSKVPKEFRLGLRGELSREQIERILKER